MPLSGTRKEERKLFPVNDQSLEKRYYVMDLHVQQKQKQKTTIILQHEVSSLPGCYAVSTGKWLTTFRMTAAASEHPQLFIDRHGVTSQKI
jgi:hypothetical protein